MSRTPDQTQKGNETDLKHLQTAYDRAKENEERDPAINAKLLRNYQENIEILSKEKFAHAQDKWRQKAGKKARRNGSQVGA